jgi:hypothetical protein
LYQLLLFEAVAGAVAVIAGAAALMAYSRERPTAPVTVRPSRFVQLVVVDPQGVGHRRAASLAKQLPGTVVWQTEARSSLRSRPARRDRSATVRSPGKRSAGVRRRSTPGR